MADIPSPQRMPNIFDLPVELSSVFDEDALARIEADWVKVCQCWGSLQFQLQLFEATVVIAAPALLAPIGDDAEAQRMVREGQGRSLHNAIGAAATAARNRVEMPSGFADRLHAARERRNVLTHNNVHRVMLAILADATAEVLTEFESDSELFDTVTRDLSPILEQAVTDRGVDIATFQMATAGIVSQVVAHPEIADGVAEFDIDVLLDRLVASLPNGDGVSADGGP